MIRRLASIIGLAILLSIGLEAAPARAVAGSDAYFDATREFPNYFLPEQFRGAKRGQIPDGVLQKSQTELEATLHSVFERITLPMIGSSGKVELTRIIPLMSDEVRRIDPGLELHVSGGVLRSAIAYLYREMYTGMHSVPPVRPEDTLRRIRESREDLPALRVLGVGSDFDMLLDGGSESTRQEAARRIKEGINAAGKKFGINSYARADAKLVVGVGDIKSYVEQTRRSEAQGGSAIDWLALNLKTGRIRVPDRDPAVLRNLLAGAYEIHKPVEGRLSDATMVRAFRPLTEIPFLRLTTPSNTYARREIESRLRAGAGLDSFAEAQLPKLVRNSFPAGANNRLLRSSADSAESAFVELTRRLPREAGPSAPPVIPRFIDYRPIPSPGLPAIPEGLLMPVAEFRKNHTKDGVFTHKTPTFDAVVSILRQGMLLSGEGQGTALYGPGAYASADPHVASGIPIPLELDTTKPVRILEWPKVESSEWIRSLERKHGLKGTDLFPVLSREYGVDVIVNTHVLVENFAALKPVPVSHLIQNPGETLLKNTPPIEIALARLEEYFALKNLAELTDGKVVDNELPADVAQVLRKGLEKVALEDWPLKTRILAMVARLKEIHPSGPSPADFFNEMKARELALPDELPPAWRLEPLLRQRVAPVQIPEATKAALQEIGIPADLLRQYEKSRGETNTRMDTVIRRMMEKYLPGTRHIPEHGGEKLESLYRNALQLYPKDPKVLALLVEHPNTMSDELSRRILELPDLLTRKESFKLLTDLMDNHPTGRDIFETLRGRPDAPGSRIFHDYIWSEDFEDKVWRILASEPSRDPFGASTSFTDRAKKYVTAYRKKIQFLPEVLEAPLDCEKAMRKLAKPRRSPRARPGAPDLTPRS